MDLPRNSDSAQYQRALRTYTNKDLSDFAQRALASMPDYTSADRMIIELVREMKYRLDVSTKLYSPR